MGAGFRGSPQLVRSFLDPARRTNRAGAELHIEFPQSSAADAPGGGQ